jgi:hypothetical protein
MDVFFWILLKYFVNVRWIICLFYVMLHYVDISESERLIRDVFSRSKKFRNENRTDCLIILDNIDSSCPIFLTQSKYGHENCNSGSSGGDFCNEDVIEEENWAGNFVYERCITSLLIDCIDDVNLCNVSPSGSKQYSGYTHIIGVARNP